jgi:hypothetical protein
MDLGEGTGRRRYVIAYNPQQANWIVSTASKSLNGCLVSFKC